MKDAEAIVKYRRIAEFLDDSVVGIKNPKAIANLIIGSVFRLLSTDEEKEQFEIKTTSAQFLALAKLVDSGKVKANMAKATFEKMLESGDDVEKFISQEDLAGVDEGALKAACQKAIAANPNAVSDYLGGKEKAFQVFIGGVMRETKGRADAGEVRKTLLELLAQLS